MTLTLAWSCINRSQFFETFAADSDFFNNTVINFQIQEYQLDPKFQCDRFIQSLDFVLRQLMMIGAKVCKDKNAQIGSVGTELVCDRIFQSLSVGNIVVSVSP